ncbi:hypothetical protein SAVCW2_37030 [Streptomyces avermitilis]|uniref:Uncharacterized protein n=1 Tax=Streptomyces avermitilis TaxID=33903 RepID=A0A499VRL5_STRAX|nr:hypothetical protein SAVMC3_49100 [Streptomyces avermitilis]GDY84504.1 hypothetical protein SAVCW2_37030 [Streptomyces avermitilis]
MAMTLTDVSVGRVAVHRSRRSWADGETFSSAQPVDGKSAGHSESLGWAEGLFTGLSTVSCTGFAEFSTASGPSSTWPVDNQIG